MSGGTVNADVLHVSGDIDCNRILPRKPLQPKGGPSPWPRLWGGTGAPPAALGAAGDFYLRADGGGGTRIYFNSAGTWGAIV